jgi:O-methyltransferase domain
VAECVIAEGAAFYFGKWTDLQMLVTVGGRERTEKEFRDLLSAAGFDLQKVIATTSPLSLLVAELCKAATTSFCRFPIAIMTAEAPRMGPIAPAGAFPREWLRLDVNRLS